jgi:dTDP-4-dehydrorhamnose 3,5-epimerase
MDISKTNLKGVYTILYKSFKDNRGEFVKTIHEDTFKVNGLDCNFTESFYSVSKKNVIRGMHFQFNPNQHDKLVYVITGRILDVVVDLRFESETFGQYFSVELSHENATGIFIEKGFAHGFLSLEENTVVEYHTTTSQVKNSEGGIRWNSFGFNWPVENPILSLRDSELADLDLNKRYF